MGWELSRLNSLLAVSPEMSPVADPKQPGLSVPEIDARRTQFRTSSRPRMEEKACAGRGVAFHSVGVSLRAPGNGVAPDQRGVTAMDGQRADEPRYRNGQVVVRPIRFASMDHNRYVYVSLRRIRTQIRG